jgi:hypothetical protein
MPILIAAFTYISKLIVQYQCVAGGGCLLDVYSRQMLKHTTLHHRSPFRLAP